MPGIYKLNGRTQEYAWGGDEYISDLLDLGVQKKIAEYWLGAHDNAPSTIDDEKSSALNDFITTDKISTLGEPTATKFGRLPFLFKVLDVHDMLSIQVHPTKSEAEKGYELENDKGIPLTAKYRNYKDDNHKPEVMVALSEFWLLHGFLGREELSKNLDRFPELSALATVFRKDGYKGLYETIMTESSEQTNSVLQPIIDRLMPEFNTGRLDKSSPDYWACKAFLTFCPSGDIDKGIYSIFLFNIVKVNPGEAIFQDAGIPHAYLEGQNMELMANSDNVLRGGLTPKHVDVPELLKHTQFEPIFPNILQGEVSADGLEKVYKTTAPDFELSKLELSENQLYSGESNSIEILIVMQGQINLESEGKALALAKGESAIVLASTIYSLETKMTAEVYKAAVPR